MRIGLLLPATALILLLTSCGEVGLMTSDMGYQYGDDAPPIYGAYGDQPLCPYGYFGYSPYRCAPYGYYGPNWFNNGVFVGTGPWFMGDEAFRGGINEGFDPRHGYRGGMPRRGAGWQRGRVPGRVGQFHGTATMDGHGRVYH